MRRYIIVPLLLIFSFISFSFANTSLRTNYVDYTKDANCVGVWRFNQDLSDTALDTQGGDKHLAVDGATYGAGKEGNGYSFDGTNDDLSRVSTIDLTGTSVITVVFWLYWDSFADDDDMCMEVTVNTNNQFPGMLILPNESATSAFVCGMSDSAGVYENQKFTRPSGAAWHHYAFVFDKTLGVGNQIIVYVDSVSQALTVVGTAFELSGNFGNKDWYFMSRAGTSLFGDGDLDEVAIFSDKLTQAEVTDIYLHGLK